MKILVAVDGSPVSEIAAKKAIEIARLDKSYVKMINVANVDEVIYDRNGNVLMTQLEKYDLLQKSVKDGSRNILDTFCEKLDTAGIEMEKETVVGNPADTILETAKNGKFDMIVMGNRGFSKIRRFFAGSVTQNVISAATCPVLVIPSGEQD